MGTRFGMLFKYQRSSGHLHNQVVYDFHVKVKELKQLKLKEVQKLILHFSANHETISTNDGILSTNAGY